MKIILLLTVVFVIGTVSSTFSQQLFRKAAFQHHSVGSHIYHHQGASTDVPTEIIAYNTTHNFTGDLAVSMYNLTDYPEEGNLFWNWWDAFRDAPGYSFKEDYLETQDYDIVIIKECFASQSDIWFYWFDGPEDTINYPHTQSIYNYQWYARKIAHKMEEYPNKFFVWWDIPPIVSTGNNVEDAARLRWFNKWMVDTLATGLDTLYGEFPPNIYVYDYFELVDSANFLPLTFAEGLEDSHPNAACSELVAPDFVEKTFNAAIIYEEFHSLPVELSAFSASVKEHSIQLNWRTETEVDNYGFDVERGLNDTWEKIGFVQGYGNSNSPKLYSFNDDRPLGGCKFRYRLQQIDTDGHFEYSEIIEVNFLPDKFELFQNYPNPFNPTTKIKYQIPFKDLVMLKVYNSLGNEIVLLVNELQSEGIYEVEFDASSLPSGIYFYRFQAGSYLETKKMTMVK